MDDIRLKKIRLRAWRRGFKEADLILGPFADRYGASMTDAELDAFEHLLNQPDPDIYDWFLGRAEPPEHVDAALMARLKAFDPSGTRDRG